MSIYESYNDDELLSLFSDWYKEVNNIRPRSNWTREEILDWMEYESQPHIQQERHSRWEEEERLIEEQEASWKEEQIRFAAEQEELYQEAKERMFYEMEQALV